MSALLTEPTDDLPPHAVLWQLAQAVIPSRALQVVADLGIADLVTDQSRPAADLAAAGLDPDALDRVLRLLSTHGIFEVDATGFRHNAVSRLLTSDHPESMRAFARLNGLPVTWRAIGALDHALQTGRPGVETVDPRGFFSYLADHPDEAAVFGLAMTQKARADTEDLLAQVDFRPFRVIADIGGGRGHLLEAVLASAPEARAVLFDLPDVIAAGTCSSDRLRAEPGDFFRDPLPEADLYLLMEIIHDWSDREAGEILAAVRRSAQPGMTVLVIEHIPPDEGTDLVSSTLDVLMLAVTGGRERTTADINALLRASGFEPSRVVRTKGAISAVEAVAV